MQGPSVLGRAQQKVQIAGDPVAGIVATEFVEQCSPVQHAGVANDHMPTEPAIVPGLAEAHCLAGLGIGKAADGRYDVELFISDLSEQSRQDAGIGPGTVGTQETHVVTRRMTRRLVPGIVNATVGLAMPRCNVAVVAFKNIGGAIGRRIRLYTTFLELRGIFHLVHH